MSDLLSVSFEIFVNLFQSFMFMVFIKRFGEKRLDNKKDLIVFYSAVLVHFGCLCLLNYQFSGYNQIEPVVLLSIYIAYSCICSRAKIFSRIFAAFLTIGITYICSAVFGFLMCAISGRSLGELMSISSIDRIICVVAVNVVLFWSFKLIVRFKNKNFDLLKWTDWAKFIVTPLLTLVIVMLCYAIALNSTLSSRNSIFLSLISLGVLVACCITYLMIIRISRDSEMKINYSMLQQRYEEQVRNIEQMKENNHRISVLKHDMSNKLSCIGELIETEKYEKALELCDRCQTETKSISMSIHCGNDIIDSVINSKSIVCAENNINFEVSVSDSLADIDDIDVCIILSNLLNNAVEAVLAVSGESMVRCEITQKRGYHAIAVSNSVASSVLKNNPCLTTTKNNKEIHGIGLKSVRDSVEKYDGHLYFEEENNVFKSFALLKMTSFT